MLPIDTLKKLNVEDFNTGILTPDSEAKSILLSIKLADFDTLIANIEAARTYIATIQQDKHKEARDALEAAAKESGFASADDLIALLTGTSITTKIETKERKPGVGNNNKSYTVVMIDHETGKPGKPIVTYNKILPASLKKNPTYIALIEKNPELKDTDAFLRAFSEEYKKDHAINAKYGKEEFYLNEKGKLNAISQKHFDDYVKKNPGADAKTFKEAVMLADKKP